jgi:hypothetical protein
LELELEKGWLSFSACASKWENSSRGRIMAEARLYSLRENSLFLVLGGAAVHRCDNQFVFSTGFSR